MPITNNSDTLGEPAGFITTIKDGKLCPVRNCTLIRPILHATVCFDWITAQWFIKINIITIKIYLLIAEAIVHIFATLASSLFSFISLHVVRQWWSCGMVVQHQLLPGSTFVRGKTLLLEHLLLRWMILAESCF